MNLLVVSDLVTGYGPTIVNRAVSLSLARGEIVTILGPNGAGKSTLLKAIAGLVKPRAGNVHYDGDASHRPGRGRDGAPRRRAGAGRAENLRRYDCRRKSAARRIYAR